MNRLAKEWKAAAGKWEVTAMEWKALAEVRKETAEILLSQLEEANKRAAFWEQMVNTQTWVVGNP